MSEVNIIAILSPSPGKEARLKELLASLCGRVHKEEDYTLRYLLTEQVDSKTSDIIMLETYKSKEGNLQHAETSYFKETFGIFAKEGLLAKKPYIVRTITRAGFDLDRKLVDSKL